jgi:hypothetical protein
MKYNLPASTGVTGELQFSNVHTSSMPLLLEGLDALYEATGKPYKVYVQGHAATRKGEIVFLNNGEWYELLDRNVTHRKLFYHIVIDGESTLVRPEQNMFAAVKVSF